MIFRQIECFLAVARCGNLSRAAEGLFVTQPTLTARIKSLEDELGDQLFVRTSRGMRLTEAGREFVPFAERCVGSFREGKRHLEELRGASGGRLALGASPGVGTYALPGLLERFGGAYPQVSVSVRTGHSDEILDMVLSEVVQIGLTREVSHPELESVQLYDDELVLVVDPQHRFTEYGRTTLAEVGEEKIILFDHDSSYYEQTRALFRNAGVSELRTLELDNIEAAKRMVAHRMGVSFLPRTSVVGAVADGDLRIVEVEDSPPLHRTIVALRRRDVPPTASVAAFLEVAAGLGESADRAELSPALAAEFENLQLIDLFS